MKTVSLPVRLVFILLAISATCGAQEALPEHLVKLLAQSRNEHDTIKIRTYVEVGRYYAKRQYDSASLYFGKGLALARKNGAQKDMLRCIGFLGTSSKNKGDYRQAIAYYHEGIVLAEQLKNTDALGVIYNNLGNTYVKTGQLDSALLFLQQSLSIKLAQKDEEGIVNSYINLGNFSATRRFYGDAKRYYLQGLEVEKKLNDPVRKSKLLINLGNSYFEMEQFDSAKHWYEEALRVKAAPGQQADWKSIYHNLGNIYHQEKNYKEALNFYRKSLELCESSGDVFKAINTLNNIGNVHREQNDFTNALVYYRQALDKAVRSNSRDQEKVILLSISECHEKQNDLVQALASLKRSKALDDELYDKEKAAILTEMQTRFESEQTEKELILQRAANEKKGYERNISLMIAALLFVLLCVGAYVYKKTVSANHKLAAQKKIIEQREHEKELLLRELHHRSKNNLQLISSLLNLQANQLKNTEAERAVKEGQARVEAMALIHRDLYRRENVNSINLKTYLEKMISNLASTYDFSATSIDLDTDIQEIELGADLAIPLGLIVNELISNTFKHAFTHEEHPRLEVIAKEQEENELRIMIRDNGKGMGDNPSTENTFGMTMVRSLVRQLSGQIAFENGNGCSTTLLVPMIRKESLAEA